MKVIQVKAPFIINAIDGNAFALTTDGQQQLTKGDTVKLGQILITDNNCQITVDFNGHNHQLLSSNQSLNFDEQLSQPRIIHLLLEQPNLELQVSHTNHFDIIDALNSENDGSTAVKQDQTQVNTEFVNVFSQVIASAGHDTEYQTTAWKQVYEYLFTTTVNNDPSSSINACINIDNITADNIINANEAKGNITVQGTVGDDVKLGDTVIITIDSIQYVTKVAEGDRWSIDVAGQLLVDNVDHKIKASVVTKDSFGHSATANAEHAYMVDTTIAASITIDHITSDDVINAAEAKTNIPVHGSVGDDVKVGDTVTVHVGDKTYTTTVQIGKTWTVDVPGKVLVDNGSHNVHASVTATDIAGNSATANADHAYTVDTTIAASITIESITSDDVINAAEAKTNIPVNGTVGDDAKVGDTVTVNVGDKSYTTAVQAGNTWTVDVPGQVLVDNGSHNVHASVSTTDTAGNSATANADHAYTVDTSIAASITIDNITSDDVINAAEAKTNIPVHGTVGDDATVGDTVTVNVGDNSYTTTVQAGNTWSIAVPGQVLVDNGSHNVHASVSTTDTAGNSAMANADHAYTVDTSIAASIVIDNITSDDVINAAEAKINIPLHGSVGDDVKDGDTVTVHVGDKTYTTTVQAGNTWTVDVPGQVLVDNGSHNVHASVSTTDNAGNSATANADHAYTVDTTIAASITIDNITSDDVINAVEAKTNIPVHGTVGDDAKVGDTVTVNVGDKSYTTTVQAGNTWTVDVPGQVLVDNGSHNVHASVSTTDNAGNSATANADHAYTVDTTIAASITIDNVTSDNVINESEATQQIQLSGSVGGDVKLGDIVTVNVAGQNLTTKVIDKAGKLSWELTVAGSLLAHAAIDNITALVTATDKVGNSITAHSEHVYKVAVLDVVVTIDAINNGKPITGIEHDNNTVIDVNGHVSGNAKIGDVVTLHFGNKTFETKVIEIAGNQLGYSAKVPAGYFVPNSNNGFTGNVEASITIHDEYQNIASAHADKNYSADGVVIVDTPSSNIIYGSGYNDVLVGDSLVVQPKIDVNLVLDTSGSMANPVIDAI
ncbi:Ig-like domain-containing protein [Shewanella marina]|uniref:Ig-like domain-containing protein n=1 Tax=Shewanella marina TaxID=487319 RepID=UPI000471420A|nr:Ig-like domain-containing protein [Shewanella marina]